MRLLVVAVLGVACSGTQSSAPPTPPTNDGAVTEELPITFNCVGKVQPEVPKAASATMQTQFVQYLLGGPGQTITTPLDVRVCARGDVACDSPLFTLKSENGRVAPLVPTGESGFDGFLLVSGSGVTETVMFFVPPITSDVDYASNGRGVPLADVPPQIAEAVGAKLDPSLGIIIVRARNCFGAPDANIALASDASTAKPFHYASGKPSTAARETDASGLAGFFGVTPGDVTITATYHPGGVRLGSARVRARAGAVTTVSLPPTP